MCASKLIVVPEGKICDYIDGKFRKDTPEEYVRQTIEKRLINEHKYKRDQVSVEFTLQVGSAKKRADLVIWEKDESHEQNNAKIIIECKSAKVKAKDAKDGIAQLQSYMSVCPNCEWGMWSNSLEKYVYVKLKDEKGTIIFRESNDIPSADGVLENIDRPTRKSLRNAVDDNLLFVFRACHNHIYANEGLQKQPAFFELLKLIFCKIQDERNIPKQLEFYTTSKEKENGDGQLTVHKRISKIFENVKKHYGKIFDENDEIKLSPRCLAYVVSELQPYSLLNTNIDIKGKAYEEIVGANLRGDRGEFFTPRNVMKMTVEMINPKIDEKVLDSSCGTGGFLVQAMTHVMERFETEFTDEIGLPREEWDTDTLKLFRERVAEIAAGNFYGFDINPDLVKATKMNMVMNNDGSGNILKTDSLLPPHEWTDDFKTKLADALHKKAASITNHKNIAFFDVIVTNPPFGSKIPIMDKRILEQFDLAHTWKKDKTTGRWVMYPDFQKSVPPEILFIERCTQLLVPGGRMGIVLPDSILGAPGLGYIREWIIANHRIIASLDLHADTFQPRNGTQTSVLILQKKTEEEKKQELLTGESADYGIFMAMIEHIGHDKRGNPVFKRDDDGNEILVSPDGNPNRQKIIDDQTLIVPGVFAKWKQEEGIPW